MIFLVFVLSGCTKDEKELSAGYKDYNIVLVSIDTLRADHLGCYGYRRTTPTIDALANRSFLFESMFTTSSTTLPAHASLMTSLYPKDLRNGYAVRDSVTTLAEVLSTKGYLCLGFVSALPLDKRFNLDQGFDYYDADFSGSRGSMHLKDNKWFEHNFQVFDRNAEETTRKVLSTLKKRTLSQPCFLWVHYYDPHLPYLPPSTFYDPTKVTRKSFPYYFNPTSSDLESLHELYDGEIQFVDQQLKKLVDGLKELDAFANTIMVLVADHGENLYEHDGYLDHSQVVYETVMRIPCLLHLPGSGAKRIDELVSIIDIMPTLLDLVGITTNGLEGESLIPLMAKEKPDPLRTYVTCETNDFGVKEEEQTVAVRTKLMKYIYNNWNTGKNLFYALAEDPRENNPRSALPGSQAQELTSLFDAWRKRYKTGNIATPLALDRETKDALKSLGYLQ
jgi:arylsulfatase A-like enzyme